MEEEKPSLLCRICLEDGAEHSLFDGDGEDSTLTKLSMCLNEKFEDIDGYPRYICDDCYKNLDTVCNFIKKYKSTSAILQSGLQLQTVKQEKENCSDPSCSEHSEVEINIEDIKYEAAIDYESDLSDNINTKSSNLLFDLKKLTKTNKSLTKTRVGSKKENISTNKVATSILEGEFVWNSRYWCFKSYMDSPEVPKIVKTKGRQKRLKLLLPKDKKPLPPKLCDLCGEVFKNQDKLSLHKRKKHYKEQVKCPHCPRLLASQYHLSRHLKRKHEAGQKDFICSTCGRAFAFKGELTGHIRKVHDKSMKDKKKFTCKICNKSYKCQKSVLIHERSAHTGHRPAVCTECGTSFYHEDYLKEHMRLHTGETPFKCPICGRGYAQRGNMKSHLRIHKISELDALTLSKIRPNYLKLLKP